MTEVIEGTVSKLRTSIEVRSGHGEHTGTSTTHIASFQVGDRAVLFRSTTLPAFDNGDVLLVAGNMKRSGQLEALAFRNKSTGVTGDASSTENWLFAIVILILGIGAVVYGFLATRFEYANAIALTLGAVAIVLGIFLIVAAAKPGSAAAELESRT